MPGIDVTQLGTVAKELPSATPDTTLEAVNVRLGTYGEQYVQSLVPTTHLLADEGSYYCTSSAEFYSPGYALTYPVSPSFDIREPFIYLFNASKPDRTSSRRIYFDYFKMVVDPGGTWAQNPEWSGVRFAVLIDPNVRSWNPDAGNMFWDGVNSADISSPNTDVAEAYNIDSSVCTLYAQNNVIPTLLSVPSTDPTMDMSAAVPDPITGVYPTNYTARMVANASLGGPSVSGDEYVLLSGSTDPAAYSGNEGVPAYPGRKVSVIPPIILGPQASMTIYLWLPGNASTNLPYEFEMGWWER